MVLRWQRFAVGGKRRLRNPPSDGCRNEIAMRHSRSLPYSRLLPVLSISILALSAAAAVVLLRQ